MANTWYLVWPDQIETISWDEYMRGHKDPHTLANWIHARGPFPGHQLAVEAMHRDCVPGYWKHGLAVYAEHCHGCGRWAKMLAGDNSAGGWHWSVTECSKCGIIDSRNLPHWRYWTHKGVWCRCGEVCPDGENPFSWYWQHKKVYK